MSPEKQRLAIAEACDWERRNPYPDVTVWEGPLGEINDDGEPQDYLNDLNAMHEAISCLKAKPSVAFAFSAKLCEVVTGVNASAVYNDPSRIWFVINATASQRAEAFLRTIGKWQDEETK